MLFLFVALLGVPSTFAQQPPVWVILHMANSTQAVTWGASAGANAIEADLIFDGLGRPTDFWHGSPCDCDCFIRYGVCNNLGPQPCFSRVKAPVLFETVRQTPKIGLVIIDSKVTASTHAAAGANVVALVEAELFRKGYNGMVIIGSPKLDTVRYLREAATAASRSAYNNRIFFTIDGEENRTIEVLRALVQLPTDGLVYGTGISACAATQYHDAIALGEVNRRAGVIGFNYIWTIDKASSAAGYLDKGAGGIMTNEPAPIVAQVRAKGYTLATTGMTFRRASSKSVKTGGPTCDCTYSPGGCRISHPVAEGWACKCEYAGAWTCGGTAVVCQDPTSAACRNPSTNFESCVQGRGDCQGYKDHRCDCNYVHKGGRPSGCKIVVAAPANAACKCVYEGAWTCGGKIVPCRNWTSQSCTQPSTNLASCQEGGGDCKGY